MAAAGWLVFRTSNVTPTVEQSNSGTVSASGQYLDVDDGSIGCEMGLYGGGQQIDRSDRRIGVGWAGIGRTGGLGRAGGHGIGRWATGIGQTGFRGRAGTDVGQDRQVTDGLG